MRLRRCTIEEARQFELMRIVGDIGTAANIADLLHLLTQRMAKGDRSERTVFMTRDLCDSSRARKLIPPGAAGLLADWRGVDHPVITSTRLRAAGYWDQSSFVPELGMIALSSVTARVKLAENFKTFLGNYRRKLKEKGLSALTDQTANASANAGKKLTQEG